MFSLPDVYGCDVYCGVSSMYNMLVFVYMHRKYNIVDRGEEYICVIK